jgi:hypothetical protein
VLPIVIPYHSPPHTHPNHVSCTLLASCTTFATTFSLSSSPFVNTTQVGGELAVYIVATRDIAAGEEVTYDYRYESLCVADRQRCACGAASCSGWLGRVTAGAALVTQAAPQQAGVVVKVGVGRMGAGGGGRADISKLSVLAGLGVCDLMHGNLSL